MCPVWNMHLSILHTLHHAVQLILLAITHSNPHSDQCTATYPSVVTRITTPPQYAWTLPTVPEMQHQNPLKMRNHQMRMRISRQYSMDDEHWTTEMVPVRTFCIHENGLPNNVCSYPCPYGTNGTTSYIDSLDLSDISDIEDHFLTTSDDEELPGLEEVPY